MELDIGKFFIFNFIVRLFNLLMLLIVYIWEIGMLIFLVGEKKISKMRIENLLLEIYFLSLEWKKLFKYFVFFVKI